MVRAGFDERREGGLQEEPAGWRPVFAEIGGEPGRDTAAERLAAEDDSVRGNLEGLTRVLPGGAGVAGQSLFRR